MEKIRLGVICPSEIAFRRFLPSLKENEFIEYVGVAIANENEWNGELTKEQKENELKKAQLFVDSYGGIIFQSYEELIKSQEIDAVYLPLPPALHYCWAKKVLNNNKHVFVEKPSTTCFEHTRELIQLAKERNLVFHENYMFQYHSQIGDIKRIIESQDIGSIHSYHSRFGFPLRDNNDFRYNKSLGGGALLDAGGYVVKLATLLLGPSIKLLTSKLCYKDDFEVDMYGSFVFTNDKNQIFFGEFGMDCEYQCNLSIWGNKGILNTNRIYTAPDGFVPIIEIVKKSKKIEIELDVDFSFQKSIEIFIKAIVNEKVRIKIYKEIEIQSKIINQIKGEITND